jgi:hypothetical protein
MTDQELLELAAKAAGLNVKAQSVNVDDRWIGLIVGEKHTKEKKFWNPLTDDGDAFRLAVKLGFFIYQIKVDDQKITVVEWDFDHVGKTMIFDEMHKDDPYAATRRAIVKAAAEIGKSMKVTK